MSDEHKEPNMVTLWALNLNERRTIEEFWEWMEEQLPCYTEIMDVKLGDLLDQYHGIDRGRLDAERRQLLDAQRALNTEEWANNPTRCRQCGKPHGLTELDAGTYQEVERLCEECFREIGGDEEM